MTTRRVDEIPVAHTPAGGWTEWPEPVLAGCADELVEGAPDLRGLWRTIDVTVDGELQPGHPGVGHVQRVEQAADRLVVTGGGVIHDMRCDGTEANGVHDVAEFDKATEIHVVATYEDGVHVLRPAGMPIEVKRWRDGPHMMWQYIGFTARLECLGPPETTQPA
ncbi:MAG: hypothetical protein QNJ12_09315 [Ilumatobacter sp.]|uniref:hypothetical protein n=1 Tax=Ilumatobacter sp. TaxID=1967498 RepID=UPI0026261E76|nr:hypothetical protein [Ilumatobacter sp.]MDJ0768982.1 hypothetical protein [Ilumatobacter sp.]